MYIYREEERGRFIHSFFFLSIFAINHIQIKHQYTEIYNTLTIIYTIYCNYIIYKIKCLKW